MAFKIQCPGCETKLKLANQPAKDTKLKCPKCEKVIKIKGAAAAPTAPKPAAAEEPVPAATEPVAKKTKAAAATAGAKASATKAKAGKSKATKAKASKSGAKAASKKKSAPPADDWDDYEDFDDDLDGDYEDDYADDDYDEPVRKKKTKGGSNKATRAKGKGVKGKGKGKDAAAKKSGGKGLKIGLAVLLGAVAIGGIAFGVSRMGGSSADEGVADNSDASSTPPGARAEAGDQAANTQANANPAANANSNVNSAASSSGQNVVNMQYLPAQTEFLVHIKVSEMLASPLFQQMENNIQNIPRQTLKPEDIRTVTLGAWLPASDKPAMDDGMGGSPMGGGMSALMGGGATLPDELLIVVRLLKSMTAADMGAAGRTTDHNGQQIVEITPPNQNESLNLWFADGQTVVMGKQVESVKAAIDLGSKENRFARFDFVNASSGHAILAAAPSDLSVFTSMSEQQSGIPAVDNLTTSLANGMTAAALSVTATNGVNLEVQLNCKDGSNAGSVQTSVAAGLEEAKTMLASVEGPMGFMLGPVKGILNRSLSSVNGNQVTVALDVNEGDITALGNSVGPFIASQMGNMGSGDSGMDLLSGGGGDVPFGSQTEHSVDFSEDIAPLLKWRCGQCHIEDSRGGLSLATYESLMAFTSASGKAVTPNDPEASTFFRIISEGKAPDHQKLKQSEIDSIRGWIEAGAPPPGTSTTITMSGNSTKTMTGSENEVIPPPTEVPENTALSYAKDIAPITQKYCGTCHINQRRGNFSMASLSSFINHTSRGNGKAIDPGNAFTSSVYKLIVDGSMPKTRNKVPKPEADLIMKWIADGAKP